jgi:hypothetical protein
LIGRGRLRDSGPSESRGNAAHKSE